MSLNTNALIASVQFHTLGNSRKDARLTTEVHAKHDMGNEAGRYQKCLVPDRFVAPLRTIMRAARSNHEQLTLDTPLGYLLPPAKAAEYQSTMTKWRTTWDAAVRKFISQWPRYLECPACAASATPRSGTLNCCARGIHKDTFDLALYPTVSELPSKFKFEFSLTPLPRAEMLDEITGLADAQIHDLRRQLNESTARAAQAARDDLMQRILFRLGNLSRCLSNPDAQVRQRTVESLTELLDSAAAYNLTNDASITRLVADCRRELTLATEVLREDDTARRRSATAAQMILAPYSRKIAA